MTAPVFIDLLERKLSEQGVEKIVPDGDVLERHARRVIEERLVDRLVRDSRTALQAASESTVLPEDLADKVRSMFKEKPELSWDAAVTALIADHAA